MERSSSSLMFGDFLFPFGGFGRSGEKYIFQFCKLFFDGRCYRDIKKKRKEMEEKAVNSI